MRSTRKIDKVQGKLIEEMDKAIRALERDKIVKSLLITSVGAHSFEPVFEKSISQMERR